MCGNLTSDYTGLFRPGASRVEKIDGMGPNDDVEAFWDKMREGQQGECIALCGHLPFLNR
jgi:phosphohistidine phosphatase SixA